LAPFTWISKINDFLSLPPVRFIITGPVDTPYAFGCFLFDMSFGESYPHAPPAVKLLTTGGGTVRFNPNLYADGKVCLSLLGTWAGSPEEQWQPNKSTLYQVFLSIQTFILVSLPYYNEVRSSWKGSRYSI
jgi:baculoviral IAP repeat-containing protein 6